MRVGDLKEGMMLRARPGLYIYGPPSGQYLKVSKFMAWWDDWTPLENEVIVYVGARKEVLEECDSRYRTSKKSVARTIREVLWRGRLWRVEPHFWRNVNPVEGESPAKGWDEPSMSLLIADAYMKETHHVRNDL